MMQVLVSEVAAARLAHRWDEFRGQAELVTIDSSGVIWSRGARVQAANPEAGWLSRDMHRTPLLGVMSDFVLGSSSVRWVQTYQAGLDGQIYANLARHGVRITRSSAQAPAIAEYVLAHVLSLFHPIAEQAAVQDARLWMQVAFREIADLHVVLIGFGAIGSEVARRLQPFGARISVVRRTSANDEPGLESRTLADLAMLLPDADVVILACPLNEQTRGVAGEGFFAAMKPGSILVNIGRGGLVDEEALKAGLSRRQPGIAVLDVFQVEPLPSESWLWRHPQVRVTAHGANAGSGVTRRGDDHFLENMRRYLSGSTLLNETSAAEICGR